MRLPVACGLPDSEAAWWLEDSCGLFGLAIPLSSDKFGRVDVLRALAVLESLRYSPYGHTRRRLGQVLVGLMELMKALRSLHVLACVLQQWMSISRKCLSFPVYSRPMQASYPRKADMKVAVFCTLQSLAPPGQSRFRSYRSSRQETCMFARSTQK